MAIGTDYALHFMWNIKQTGNAREVFESGLGDRGGLCRESVDGERAPGVVRPIRLHYANGPIFEPAPTEGLDAYVTLGVFETDVVDEARGFPPGEMLGTPAMLAARYGTGRLVLFSPNPALDPARPDILLGAIRWAATAGAVPPTLTLRELVANRSVR